MQRLSSMTTPRPNKRISKLHNLSRRCVTVLAGMALLLCPVRLSMAQSVVDQQGRTHEFARPFKRIISLYGAHTENLFYLGAGEQVIGVSINDTYPAGVKSKQKFSYHDDPEKFIAVRPDLVLIRPMIENGYPGFVRQLQAYGITVISFQPAAIEDVYEYWLSLGELTGKTREAATLVSHFKEHILEIQKRTAEITPKKRVYFQAIHRKMRTFTFSAMPIFALETAGGINIASDAKASRNTNVAIYGKERILSKAGDIDVFLAQKGIMNPIRKSDILNEPGFQIIKAVKENQVYLIDESMVSRPVPRLYQGILTIGNILYPDIFTTTPKEETL